MKVGLNVLAVLAAVHLVAAATTATAGPLVFEYTGTVIRVVLLNGATDTLGYAAGQKINGSFSVDRSVPDADASTIRSFQPWSIRSFTFDAIAADINFLNYSYFMVDADPAHDHVNAYALAINQQVADLFQFSLEEGGPTAVLGDDSVDLTTLNLAAFDPSDTRFEFRRIVDLPSGQRQESVITTSIDTLRVYDVATPVPEPGTIPLAMTALGVLWLAMRRRESPTVCV